MRLRDADSIRYKLLFVKFNQSPLITSVVERYHFVLNRHLHRKLNRLLGSYHSLRNTLLQGRWKQREDEGEVLAATG
jgi:hypothetical protein